MGYYIRVLTTSEQPLPVPHLETALRNDGLDATLHVEAGTAQDWSQLALRHADGTEIAALERNPVGPGTMGAEELEEFSSEIEDERPASAVKWLKEFFSKVKCIYALQVLSGTGHGKGWDILGRVKNTLHSAAPSILQADSEGFTNEAGYHILWKFSDTVTGKWWMGVLKDDRWHQFQMDLGNRKHREAFWKGEIPQGAKLQ